MFLITLPSSTTSPWSTPPGILSGQKQSIGRNYDYEHVMRWLAERADLIIIMFDAHKLDISDERRVYMGSFWGEC